MHVTTHIRIIATACLCMGKRRREAPRPEVKREEQPIEDIDEDDVEVVQPLVINDESSAHADTAEAVAASALASDDCSSVLAWLLGPLDLDDFFSLHWETRPVVVKRSFRDHYRGLFSLDAVDALLRAQNLRYGTNIDVTKYDRKGAGRVTLNGREGSLALPEQVWARYKDGCSIRVLHPQRWSDPLHALLHAMERLFGCAGGCNTYLTPAGTQGFAPHYDDIDAFVLQLEGRKLWRLYAPRTASEVLPRHSSANLEQSELGPMILEVTLEPGDLLYMPRGTVHQARSLPDSHSLHATVSTAHATAWADLLELAIPQALAEAIAEEPALRRTLPLGTFDCAGAAFSEPSGAAAAARRAAWVAAAEAAVRAVVQRMPWDGAVDQLAKRFQQSRLPPPAPAAAGGKLAGGGRRKGNGAAGNGVVTDETRVRVAWRGAIRLVVEGDSCVAFHPMSNPRAGHMAGYGAASLAAAASEAAAAAARAPGGPVPGAADASEDEGPRGGGDGESDEDGEEEEEVGAVSFPLEAGTAVEQLILAYPKPLRVGELEMPSAEERSGLVARLLGAGALVRVAGGGGGGGGGGVGGGGGGGCRQKGDRRRQRL